MCSGLLEMKEIDLHGMRHQEAFEVAENFVLLESQDELFECKIITGNSWKMKIGILNMLDKHKFKYYVPTWNMGEVIVSNY